MRFEQARQGTKGDTEWKLVVGQTVLAGGLYRWLSCLTFNGILFPKARKEDDKRQALAPGVAYQRTIQERL